MSEGKAASPAIVAHITIGPLLRVHAMVAELAYTDAANESVRALVHAYNRLRDELLLILQPDALGQLRTEFERLFPGLNDPPPFDRATGKSLDPLLLAGWASEAKLGIKQLQGWIQGLIDELTLERRLQLEAEAKAKRSPTGFTPP